MRPATAVLPPRRLASAVATASASIPPSAPRQTSIAGRSGGASCFHAVRAMSSSRPTASGHQHCAFFHRTAAADMPRRRSFFTSNVLLGPGSSSSSSSSSNGNGKTSKAGPSAGGTTELQQAAAAAAAMAKRKPRAAGAKHSLRRVAVMAQQQPGGRSTTATAGTTQTTEAEQPAEEVTAETDVTATTTTTTTSSTAFDPLGDDVDGRHVISAVCLAESFDMVRVMAILQAQGFALDPDGSGFESHEVVHARKRWEGRDVDLFVFESGTLVGWGLPAEVVDGLATGPLVEAAAAVDPFVADRETETLEFRRDDARDTSALRGSDVVVLGTRREADEGDRLATTRAQIAFSSGLARSTKLAALERSFTAYFESTRRIPELLAGKGGHARRVRRRYTSSSSSSSSADVPPDYLSQRFILQKTGELLSLRAQLNHYRELTDALPDIFWDARAELGLEGYYEQVGRALDVGVRIKTLNQKMDYAQEIATVLREVSSERHGTRLEWIIIVLITVEVVFELRRVYLDFRESQKAAKDKAT